MLPAFLHFVLGERGPVPVDSVIFPPLLYEGTDLELLFFRTLGLPGFFFSVFVFLVFVFAIMLYFSN